MYQPNFDLPLEVWDNNEEVQRRGDVFALAAEDFVTPNQVDQLRQFHIEVRFERPILLEGARNIVVGGVDGDDIITHEALEILLVSNDYVEVMAQPLPYGDLTAFMKMVVIPIGRMESLINNNPAMVTAIRHFRSTLPPNDIGNWLFIALMMATVHPHPLDKKQSRTVDEVPPGFFSVERATRMIFGRRGLIHGWSGEVPDIRRELLVQRRKWYICPRSWAPASNTDGGSSYCSHSSGRLDSDAESGPRGVSRNRVPATGMSDCSNTSSCLSGHEPVSRLSVFESGGPEDENERKKMKRFFSYMARSNRERRERRDVRRSRRRIRANKSMDYNDSEFPANQKAELVASFVRVYQNHQYQLEAHNKMVRKWRRDFHQYINKCSTNESKVEEESHEIRNYAKFRFKRLRLALREQVSKKWLRFCDPRNDLVKTARMKFHCWMTPVRWIKQSGPK